MSTRVGTYACLIALASLGTARGDDTAQELAQIAGEWVAESSVRTGQEPAKKAVLKGLTLEVAKTSDIAGRDRRSTYAPITAFRLLNDYNRLVADILAFDSDHGVGDLDDQMCATKIHADQLEPDERFVRRLIADQFP